MKGSIKKQKRILLLPSWYPNRDHSMGSFFKEQAQFLNEQGFDVKILMGRQLHSRSHLYHKMKRWFKGKSNHIVTSYLDQGPEAFSFSIILQNNWSEKRQYDFSNQTYLRAFKELIKTGWKPDVIHVQGTFRAGFSAEKISKTYKIPYVIIEHSPFKLAAFSDFKQNMIKSALMNADKVAAVSHYQKKRMKEDGINRPISVIWNLMDEERFHLKENSKGTQFVISTITTPNKVKDIVTFFKGVAKFVDKINDRNLVEIVVVGNNIGTTDTSYYEEQAQSVNILDLCTFISHMERASIEELLWRSNVFISTSLDEPYGVAIREAMLCGTPVISTRSGGPEDSINEKTGVLVNIGDYNDIAKHLFLIKNESLKFDKEYIRDYIINQSGRKAFLNSMIQFYSLSND